MDAHEKDVEYATLLKLEGQGVVPWATLSGLRLEASSPIAMSVSTSSEIIGAKDIANVCGWFCQGVVKGAT